MSYQAQRQQAVTLFERATTVARKLIERGLKDEDLENRLEAAQRDLLEGKLMVVVCGEIDKGKSTLINALLDEPDLLPGDHDLSTSRISIITYGVPEAITLVRLKGADSRSARGAQAGEPFETEVQTIQRREIANYVTEQRNPQNREQVQTLIIKTPHSSLRGITLVDTPGVGGLVRQHAELTANFLQTADLVIFVTDKTLLDTEERFIEQKILPYCSTLLFVQTKVEDKGDGGAALLQKNRGRLSQILKRPGEQIPCVAVSSHLKLAYLASNRQDFLKLSNFPKLESLLWGMVGKQQSAVLVLEALRGLEKMVEEMERPLRNWRSLYQPEVRVERQKQEQATRQKLEELKVLLADQEQERWQAQIHAKLAETRARVQQQIRAGYSELRQKAQACSERDQAQELDTEEVEQRHTIVEFLNQRLTDLNSVLEDSHNLTLESFSDALLNWSAAKETEAFSASEASRSVQMRQQGRYRYLSSLRLGTLSYFMVGGGFAGAALGSVFGPVGSVSGFAIGKYIGAGVGMVSGLVLHLWDARPKENQQPQQWNRMLVEDLHRREQRLGESIQRELQKVEKLLIESRTRYVQDQLHVYQQEAAAYTRLKASDVDAANRETSWLDQRLEDLQRLGQEVKELMNTILENSPVVEGD